MKSFEEIRDKYDLTDEVVEMDLYTLLCAFAKQTIKRTVTLEGEYKSELSQYLQDHQFVIFEFPDIKLTERGQSAIKNKWVVKDLKSIKKKELTPIRQSWIAIAIAGASLVFSVFGIFFPIPVSKPLLETKEFVIESVNSPVDTVANAGKSYDCESLNCQKNKN